MAADQGNYYAVFAGGDAFAEDGSFPAPEEPKAKVQKAAVKAVERGPRQPRGLPGAQRPPGQVQPSQGAGASGGAGVSGSGGAGGGGGGGGPRRAAGGSVGGGGAGPAKHMGRDRQSGTGRGDRRGYETKRRGQGAHNWGSSTPGPEEKTGPVTAAPPPPTVDIVPNPSAAPNAAGPSIPGQPAEAAPVDPKAGGEAPTEGAEAQPAEPPEPPTKSLDDYLAELKAKSPQIALPPARKAGDGESFAALPVLKQEKFGGEKGDDLFAPTASQKPNKEAKATKTQRQKEALFYAVDPVDKPKEQTYRGPRPEGGGPRTTGGPRNAGGSPGGPQRRAPRTLKLDDEKAFPSLS